MIDDGSPLKLPESWRLGASVSQRRSRSRLLVQSVRYLGVSRYVPTEERILNVGAECRPKFRLRSALQRQSEAGDFLQEGIILAADKILLQGDCR
jgi:hypothetical protein